MRRSEFDRLVRSALERVPEIFRAAMTNVEIVIEDWPDPDLMEELYGERDAVVYGMFSGRAITERHFGDWGDPPSLIYVYQGPLEEDFPDRKDLEREIETTVVHEIAHYMGLGEEVLAEYGYD
jgi:predicted Zn-dependent protease with MMP-like domain